MQTWCSFMCELAGALQNRKTEIAGKRKGELQSGDAGHCKTFLRNQVPDLAVLLVSFQRTVSILLFV